MLIDNLSSSKKNTILADEDLYKLLVDDQYLEKAQLDKALKLAKQKKSSLYDELISLDLMSDENLGKITAGALKLPFISLSKITIADEILRILPQIIAQKHKMIVFGKGKDGLHIAINNINQDEMLNFISKKTGEKTILYFATIKDIEEALKLYRKELQKTYDELLKEQVETADKTISKEAPVSRIVDLLIEYAYDNKASDIHIEPLQDDSLVRFRVDGILHDVLHFPKETHSQTITRIKVLSKLRTDEHLAAQDGKLQLKMEREDLDVRVSIVPVVNGEKCVMRLLSSRSRQFSLIDLGMSQKNLSIVETAYRKPYGMILSTGPTGSGKTTSMYSIIKILNTREKNIATIEDPVEYEIDGINQIQVNPKTNLTFAEGLRSILRQDPDIVLVGEIRDRETADIAINSAMTGQLVLSTLHTNNAATALPRLIDMGIEPFLVASTVNIIISQRLVRKICERCKVSFVEDINEINKYFDEKTTEKYFKSGEVIRLYRGKGCLICHGTGYLGRVGLFEVLGVSSAIQELISKKEDAPVINKKAIEEGMITMFEDGLIKMKEGITTLEEILRVTRS